MLPQNEALGQYKLVTNAIPEGARYSRSDTDRQAADIVLSCMPDRTQPSGQPPSLLIFFGRQIPAIPYFYYLRHVYAPNMFWYVDRNEPVSWSRVRENYRYLLVTVPWDAGRIPLPYTVVKENDVAALLDIKGR